MEIVIDPAPIIEFFKLPPHLIVWRLFIIGGWIPMAVVFLYGAKEMWLAYIRRKWHAGIKYILLAIDIPRGNEQSPKAVENIFSYLAGAHGSIDLIEKYWAGKFQPSFSLEIVSIDGYTQFLIRSPEQFRNLVESAIYSQYPDAEITEVNDYTEGYPTRYPDEEYDIYGAEFIQTRKAAYPIKVYKDFEYQLSPPGAQYKDPMASLMDLYSSLRKGEQLWFQILVIPIGFDWPKIGDQEISKVLGEAAPAGSISKILAWFGEWFSLILSPAEEIKKNETQDTFKILNLKPKEKKQIEAIQDKVSKLGFEFKMRLVYLAKKDVMNKPKCFGGFVGFMKQFAALDLNNIKPDMDTTATRASYFFKESRINAKKNRLINNYINRDDWSGKLPGILNIEELAAIWHFPIEGVVKAPLIQKAPGRKAEAPSALPVSEEIPGEELMEPIFDEQETAAASQAAPVTAPVSPAAGEPPARPAVPGGQPPANLPFA